MIVQIDSNAFSLV